MRWGRRDVPAVQAFWTAALGYVADERPGLTEIHDPRRRNRTHLVLTVPADAVRTRLDAALAAGGRLLADDRVADPEGNELVIAAG